MRIGNKVLDTDNGFYMMGILNVTPDSFSDGGRFTNLDAALRQAETMVADGCDILDVGGESTRPGHKKISNQEEMDRVCPVIEALKARFDVPVSLDTYKSEVAKAGILAGADLINDIWGLKWDADMAQTIAEHDVSCCLMHNRQTVLPEEAGTSVRIGQDKNPYGYQNFLEDVATDLQESIALAKAAGIREDGIMLDPGIGFAKDLAQNLYMMQNLEIVCGLGYPVLLGTSRKSMIGLTLDLPVEEREEGTIATSVLGYQKGCRIFRVHDVKANKRALQMIKGILDANHI